MNYNQRIEIHNLAVVNGYNVSEADKFAKTHTYEEAKRKYGRDIHYAPINYNNIHVREKDKIKKDGYNKKYFTEEEKKRAHVERQKRYLQRKKERMLSEKK